MAKHLLKVATAGLLGGALLLTISTDTRGHVHLFKSAKALTQNQKLYKATCPDGKTTIYVCGVGDFDCTPSGTCPSS